MGELVIRTVDAPSNLNIRRLREETKSRWPEAEDVNVTDYGETVSVYFDEAATYIPTREEWRGVVQAHEGGPSSSEARASAAQQAEADLRSAYDNFVSLLGAGEYQVSSDLSEVEEALAMDWPSLPAEQRWAQVLAMLRRQRRMLNRQRVLVGLLRRLVRIVRLRLVSG